MCAHHVREALVAGLLVGFGLLNALRCGLTYLLANERRANPNRDRHGGRLRAGLTLMKVAK